MTQKCVNMTEISSVTSRENDLHTHSVILVFQFKQSDGLGISE